MKAQREHGSGKTETIRCPLHYHDTLNQPCRIGSSYAQVMTYGYPNTYLHPGIDLLGLPGQKVYSVADGIVKAILIPDFHKSPDMWRIAISNGLDPHERNGYLYAHIERESIPFQVGDTVKAGDCLGKLVKWFQENYTHVHFSEIVNEKEGVEWEGKWLAVQEQKIAAHGKVDQSVPSFEKCKEDQWCLFKNREGNALPPNGLSGEFQIIFQAYDFSNSTYKNGITEIEYEFRSLKKKKGKSLFSQKQHLTFNMPIEYYISSTECTEQVRNFYCLETPCQSVCNQGYERHYFYFLLNRNKADSTSYTVEDTYFNKDNHFPMGAYALRISIKDYFGNKNEMEMKVRIVDPNRGK